MLKFTLILFSFLLCNYDYSLEDFNPTSPSYQNNVWNPEYSNHITMHYFSTQGWAGWTATFGQLSNFQDELKDDDGYENIVIIAVGQTNISAFNSNFCANSDLPLVMDPYPDLPIRQQFAPFGIDHYLVILDYDGNYIDHIDLPTLGNSQKNYIREILEEYYEQSILGDVNGDATVNVQDIILIVNSILSGQINPSGDINGDGLLNILDVVQVTNIILSP